MLEFHFSILVAQLINFAILYYIFHRFVWKKLTQGIYERQQQLEKLRLAEVHYKERMELAEKERAELLSQAKKTSEELMKESEHIAKLRAQEILFESHEKAMAILDGGKRELEKERISMLAQMKSHIIDISLRLNQKIFGSQKLSQEFLEKELEKL